MEKLPSDRNWSIATSLGSLAAAVLASACCVGPLVLALLGLGGAGLLVKFEPYRPYFVGMTLALLGAGFYLSYRKPQPAGSLPVDGPDCACPAPRASRAGRITLWIATVLVVVLLAFPYLAPHVFG